MVNVTRATLGPANASSKNKGSSSMSYFGLHSTDCIFKNQNSKYHKYKNKAKHENNANPKHKAKTKNEKFSL